MMIVNPELAICDNKWAVVTEENANDVPDNATFVEYVGSVNINPQDLQKLCWRPAHSKSFAQALSIPYIQPVHEQPISAKAKLYGHAEVDPESKPITKAEPAKPEPTTKFYDASKLFLLSTEKLVEVIQNKQTTATELQEWAGEVHMQRVRDLGYSFNVRGRSKKEIILKVCTVQPKAEPAKPKSEPTPTQDDLYTLAKRVLAKMDKLKVKQLMAEFQNAA